MSEACCKGPSVTPKCLHRLLSTSIAIFDSAMTLLGGPSEEGVKMPPPALVACVRVMLGTLGVRKENERFPFLD